MSERPRLSGILETALYHAPGEAEQMERFYREVLGLPIVAKWGDGTALRLGSGVLLLFDRDGLAERDEPAADHGTAGPGHTCLVALDGEYEAWKERLAEAGTEVTHEEAWPGGKRSFYFKDPAGNLLEIAEADIWPVATPSR
jgi:catechol 2,3-dioxygenase-like lactoylglutathione lyase family enzyme